MALTTEQEAARLRLANEYNGEPYDSTSNPKGLAEGGHRVNELDMIRDVATVVKGAAEQTDAASSAAGNAQSALMTTTSATSLTIGTGTQTFVVAAERQFAVNQYVSIASTSDPTNSNMFGQVTAWTPGTLTLELDVSVITGGGTFTDWTVGVVGPRGPQGAAGSLDIPGLTAIGTLDPSDLLVAYDSSAAENKKPTYGALTAQIMANGAILTSAIFGI